MGILSLTSFVDENQQLLTDLRLHDTRVVIDGNNLYHFCYNYFNFHHQYGGDYDTFAEKIRYYFSAFRACNMEPYVVFDGAYDEDDKKLPTTVKRAKDRLYNACLISAGKRAVICPILTFETFVNVLNELKINHVTCDFEADREIAALAVEWNCPVMSNDSDFFIYDVRGGFILFDYLSLVVKTCPEENYRYLAAQVYYVDNLLSYVPGMERKCIALFATLMGNDYVNTEDFATFFAHHSFPRASSKRFRTSKRHERMIGLLSWLEAAGNLEEAIQSLLGHVKKAGRDRIEKLVRMSVSSYLQLNDCLSGYFSAEKSADRLRSKLQIKGKHSIPSWFTEQVRCSNIAVTALNTLVHRRIVLLAQIEMVPEASAYDCSRSLRQKFYAILLSLDSTSAAKSVDEYTRQGKRLKKNSVEVPAMLPDGTEALKLVDIPQTSADARAGFLLQCLGDNDLAGVLLDDCYMLAVHVIPYWLTNAVPSISVLNLYALVACFIKTSLLDKKHGRGVPNKDGRRTLKEMCDASTRGKARDNMDKLCQRESSHVLDVESIHAYSQFQACLKAAMYLNSLLLQPLPQTQPDKLLNGTCFYSLSRELKLRKCPKLYVEELLGRESKLADFFARVVAAVLEAVPQNCVVYPETGKKNSQKRAKGSREKAAVVVQACEEQSSGSGGDDGDSTDTLSAACSLGNRFALLELSGAA